MTDENGRAWLDEVRWNSEGLVPAIAQDADSGRVLMLAWMNRDSLSATLKDGYATYWSRSRRKLWRKGESSGHVQRVVDVRLDCDADTLLLLVEQTGAACHTGRTNCFFRSLKEGHTEWTDPAKQFSPKEGSKKGREGLVEGPREGPEEGVTAKAPRDDTLKRLWQTLQERKTADPGESYVAGLYGSALDRVLKKIGEEATELVLAAKASEAEKETREIVHETADLWFHTLVLLAREDIALNRVLAELERRLGTSGLAEKAARRQENETQTKARPAVGPP